MKYNMADIKSENNMESKVSVDSKKDSPVEPKMENKSPKVSSKDGSASKNIVVIIIVILLAILIPLGILLFVQNRATEADGILGLCKCSTETADADATDTADDVAEVADTTDDAETEEPQRISLGGDDYFDVRADWDVVKIETKYENLPYEDLQDISTDLVGAWPIYESTDIMLANGSSTFTIQQNAAFIPIATGFYSQGFEPADYTVLVEPTNTDYDVALDEYGVARKDLGSGSWEYYRYYANPEVGGLYTEEFLTDHDIPSSPRFIFTGEVALLDEADEMYLEYCIENTTGLCQFSE